MRSLPRLIAAIGVLVLFLAACGGSDDAASSPVSENADGELVLDATLDTVFGEDAFSDDDADSSAGAGDTATGERVSTDVTELPAEMPSDLPRPAISDVGGYVTTDADRLVSINVYGVSTADTPSDAVTTYASQLEALGFEGFLTQDESYLAAATYTRDFETVQLTAQLLNEGTSTEYVEFGVIYSD